MGQDQSQSQEDRERLLQQQSELNKIEGFQVVRLLPRSPAHQAGLVPYFDLITALDHNLLSAQEAPHFKYFKQYLSDHRDQQVCFTVYNLKLRSHRDVFIVPSDHWGGGGLLGCSVEWAQADKVVQRSWHIVGILDGSPASFCPDLHEDRDYIIGMQQPDQQLIAMLKNDDDFYGRLAMWQELQRTALERKARFPDENVEVPHSLLLLVYDVEENSVKEVLVDMGTRPGTPLGISVATGLLHLIPISAPGSKGADDGHDVPDLANLPYMNRFYVPRDLNFEVDYPATTGQQPSQPQQLPQPPAQQGASTMEPGNEPHDPQRETIQLQQRQPPPQPPLTHQQQPQHAEAVPGQVPMPQNPFGGGAAINNPFASGLAQQHQQDEFMNSNNSHGNYHEDAAITHSGCETSQQPPPQPPHPLPSHEEHQAPTPNQLQQALPAPPPQSYPQHQQHYQPPPPPPPPHTYNQPQLPQPSFMQQQQQQNQTYHQAPPPPPQQPVRFEFPQVPPPLDFPSFPRPQRSQ